jgi:LAO/AO transport system kinase
MTDYANVQPPSDQKVDELVLGVIHKKTRDIARAITIVENQGVAAESFMAALASCSETRHRARTIGITGAPGVGKSTMTAALISSYRSQGLSVAVLAVDPSSPFSGGALLGDRIRMQSHSSDPEVFIRSMASRGHLGGLAATAGQVLRVFDAAGFDVVLIETVGVGQSEVEIAAAADTTVVLLAPGMGDGIQAAKAGILEIGDVFVVNKADREGAQSTARDVRNMLALGHEESASSWKPSVVTSVASTGQGIPEVMQAIDSHHEWALHHGELQRRRLVRAREEVMSTLVERIRGSVFETSHEKVLNEVSQAVSEGDLAVYQAADTLWRAIIHSTDGANST